MGALTVRNVDDDLIRQLEIRAAKKGVSAEEEHLTLVTRKVRDFAPLDLPTLNPWLG